MPITFKASKRKNKKYDATITEGGKTKTVSFGDSRYQQYYDKIGLYSHLDHKDPKRRRLYRQRHNTNPVIYSPGWFSLNYLW